MRTIRRNKHCGWFRAKAVRRNDSAQTIKTLLLKAHLVTGLATPAVPDLPREDQGTGNPELTEQTGPHDAAVQRGRDCWYSDLVARWPPHRNHLYRKEPKRRGGGQSRKEQDQYWWRQDRGRRSQGRQEAGVEGHCRHPVTVLR